MKALWPYSSRAAQSTGQSCLSSLQVNSSCISRACQYTLLSRIYKGLHAGTLSQSPHICFLRCMLNTWVLRILTNEQFWTLHMCVHLSLQPLVCVHYCISVSYRTPWCSVRTIHLSRRVQCINTGVQSFSQFGQEAYTQLCRISSLLPQSSRMHTILAIPHPPHWHASARVGILVQGLCPDAAQARPYSSNDEILSGKSWRLHWVTMNHASLLNSWSWVSTHGSD